MKIKPFLFGCGLIICSTAVFAQDCQKEIANKNWQKAFSACTKEAQQGNAKAQSNLGLMYYNGDGVTQDKHKGFEWVEKAAQQGYARAQFAIGSMYDEGEGVTQDYQKAKELFEKAAKQEVAQAQFVLGLMSGSGEGVRQDYQKAFEWFGKACDNGLQEGCDTYKKFKEAGIR